MAISQKQIMDRAYRLAVGRGMDAHASPITDNLFVFEDAFPLALREACKQDASENLKRRYNLTFVSGVAVMPDTVLEEFLDRSILLDSVDPDNSEFNSYQWNLNDFYYPANTQLGHYTVDGNSIRYRAPNEDADTHAGAAVLVTIGVPDIPGTITTDLGIATELAEKTIEILSLMALGGGGTPVQ
jgi:hypothetical protein